MNFRKCDLKICCSSLSQEEILLDFVNIAFESHDFVLKSDDVALLEHDWNVFFVKFVKGTWYFL